jgi:hypothetical protein
MKNQKKVATTAACPAGENRFAHQDLVVLT